MRGAMVAAVVLLLGAGCSGAEEGEGAAADTLTQRQRDSIIGESSLPGAVGVRRALEVTDSVNARRSALDTLQ